MVLTAEAVLSIEEVRELVRAKIAADNPTYAERIRTAQVEFLYIEGSGPSNYERDPVLSCAKLSFPIGVGE